MTRECDNDDCDYETYVDSEGRAKVRWIHVGRCEGMVEFRPPSAREAHPDSFLAYLLG